MIRMAELCTHKRYPYTRSINHQTNIFCNASSLFGSWILHFYAFDDWYRGNSWRDCVETKIQSIQSFLFESRLAQNTLTILFSIWFRIKYFSIHLFFFCLIQWEWHWKLNLGNCSSSVRPFNWNGCQLHIWLSML